jgi:hypothetical protein
LTEYDNTQLPGPPRARQVVGAAVLLMSGLVLLGWVPLEKGTFGVALLLVGAGLLA